MRRAGARGSSVPAAAAERAAWVRRGAARAAPLFFGRLPCALSTAYSAGGTSFPTRRHRHGLVGTEVPPTRASPAGPARRGWCEGPRRMPALCKTPLLDTRPSEGGSARWECIFGTSVPTEPYRSPCRSWSPLATRALPASTNVPGMAYRASERRSAARRNCLRRRDRARETGPFMVHASMKTCCSAGRVPATSSLTWHFISSETS